MILGGQSGKERPKIQRKIALENWNFLFCYDLFRAYIAATFIAVSFFGGVWGGLGGGGEVLRAA